MESHTFFSFPVAQPSQYFKEPNVIKVDDIVFGLYFCLVAV